MYIHTHTIYIYIYIRACTHTHTHKHTHTHTHTHSHTHTHQALLNIFVRKCPSSSWQSVLFKIEIAECLVRMSRGVTGSHKEIAG